MTTSAHKKFPSLSLQRCSDQKVSGQTEMNPLFPQFDSQLFRFHTENCIDINQATVYFYSRRRLKGLAK